MLKIGVIGVGKMGSLHAEKFAKLGCEVNIYDCDQEAAKHVQYWSQISIGLCETLEEIINKSDAVVVATPATSLCRAELALLEGKHVLVEKPMALTSFSAKAMRDTALVLGRVLHIGYVERFHPCIHIANSLIREQKPTQMMAVRGCKFTGRGTDVSVVLDLMVHDIYRMLMIDDSPIISIEADGHSRLEETVGVDTAYARIGFRDGFMAFLSVTRDGNASLRMHHISTNEAIFSIDMLKGTLMASLKDASDCINKDFNYPKEDPLLSQASDFISVIESKYYESAKLIERAIKTLEIAEQIEEAIIKT